MKVIDLLNKIANGEEAPERIKFENYIYIWRNDQKDYFCKQINHSLESIIGEYLFCNLNLEVEILDKEDEFIDIEELEGTLLEPREDSNLDTKILCCLANTIKDLIKNQKKIIEKLKEEGK